MRPIDADALIEFCAERWIPLNIDAVNMQRPIQLEPHEGHWIPVTNGRGGHECDRCREYAPSYQSGDEHLSKYCPNCGAKMKGDSK